MACVQIFLSTVSAEFGSYRNRLRDDLTLQNVSVKVQENFVVTGTETLDMLDDYIRQCDAVIHLVGDMTGASAQHPSLAVIRQRYPTLGEKLPPLAPFLEPGAPALSYTQWEAWLALYHGKPLIIAVPEGNAPRDESYKQIPEQRTAQQAHLQRLAEMERYPFCFANADRLAVEVLRSKLQEILAQAGPLVRPANLPFLSLGVLFKGREEKIDELTQSLGPIPESITTPVVARVLAGLGGVGKTRLALEYAWRHVTDYTALLFVGASSPEALQRNLAALCHPQILDLPERQEKEEVKQYEAVLRWLRQQTGWLLILDNVDSKPAAVAVRDLLPQLRGGHVLLTSRLTIWKAPLVVVKLETLEPKAAVDFVLARTDASRRKQADDVLTAQTLVQELGCLSLALEQASAYIEQQQGLLSFEGYLAQWRTCRSDLLDWQDELSDEQAMEYTRPLAITWQTSYHQLTPSAQQLLQRLAWLAPDPIPESLLDVPVPEHEASVPNAFAPLAELLSYSLVVRVADHTSFTVHRLVQEVTRRSQRDESGHTSLLDTLCWIDAAFAGDPENPGNWAVLDPILPHARAVSIHADSEGVPGPTARLMNQVGVMLYAKAQYAEAEPLYQRALVLREQVLGATHPDVAQSLNNLAALYQTQGAYAEAEPLYQRALAISVQVLGPAHPDVAQSLNNLATLYHAQGAYAEAAALYQQALVIREQALGAAHPDIAQSLNNLATLYRNQGAYAEAAALYQRALAISVQVLGPAHPDVAQSLNSLGELYHDQGGYAEAERLYQRALVIREQALGPAHPDVAQSLNNLATLYHAQGAYAETKPLLRRALAIYEQALGPAHPHVATSLNNLAELYRNQGAYAEAAALYQRALAISVQVLGPAHPDVAQSLNNLAILYKTQGAYAEAERLYQRALVIREQALGPAHSDVAQSLNNLATLYHAQGAYAEAEPLLRRALAIYEQALGPAHPDVAQSLNNLAMLYHAQGAYAEAEPLLRRALTVFPASEGSEHTISHTIRENYVGLLQATGKSETEISDILESLGSGRE